MRLGEEVGIAVELRHLEQDIGRRYVDDVLDAEQQVEPLTDADVVVLLDLIGCQRKLVDRHHAKRALPRTHGAGIRAQHEREGIVPAAQRSGGCRVGIRHQRTVNVNLAALGRAESRNDVLQCRLQDFIAIGRR